MAAVVPWTTAIASVSARPGVPLEVYQTVYQRGDHLVGRGRDLQRADTPILVHDDEVAERAADIDADAVHARRCRALGAGGQANRVQVSCPPREPESWCPPAGMAR